MLGDVSIHSLIFQSLLLLIIVIIGLFLSLFFLPGPLPIVAGIGSPSSSPWPHLRKLSAAIAPPLQPIHFFLRDTRPMVGSLRLGEGFGQLVGLRCEIEVLFVLFLENGLQSGYDFYLLGNICSMLLSRFLDAGDILLHLVSLLSKHSNVFFKLVHLEFVFEPSLSIVQHLLVLQFFAVEVVDLIHVDFYLVFEVFLVLSELEVHEVLEVFPEVAEFSEVLEGLLHLWVVEASGRARVGAGVNIVGSVGGEEGL